MATLLEENLAKDLDDYYDPEKSLEDYNEELSDPGFNKKTPLAKSRHSRFIATKSLFTMPGFVSEDYSEV